MWPGLELFITSLFLPLNFLCGDARSVFSWFYHSGKDKKKAAFGEKGIRTHNLWWRYEKCSSNRRYTSFHHSSVYFFLRAQFFFFFFFSINLYVMDLGNRFNHIDEALIDIYNCTSVFILYYMVMVSQISVQLFTSNKCKLQRILATIWKQVDKWNPNDWSCKSSRVIIKMTRS